jgi:organic radical activating enzyme
MPEAYLHEIFASIQGEGLYAGTPALFLRFGGCNLECTYCDTPQARVKSSTFKLHREGDTREFTNPIACSAVIDMISGSVWPPVVVFTGGEPLLQPDVLVCLAKDLRRAGCRIHLETNGTLTEAMKQVRHSVDFICADIKLPSTQTGGAIEHQHSRFLDAMRGKRGSAKIVITAEASDEEVLGAAGLIAGVNPDLPVFVQPAFAGDRPVVDGERLHHVLALASGHLRDVRVSLQLHKILNLR